MAFIILSETNLSKEHLCCAIAGKKHKQGVELKKQWLAERIKEGHVFRKLDQKGKIFIEYAPLETAWVPIEGNNYLYIYCLWVAGSFKKKGYGKKLLNSCIENARKENKSGVCIISSKKKKPFLSDKKFMIKYGFQVVDSIEDYELLAISFDKTSPQFTETVRKQQITGQALTIYYGLQCPYITNCIKEIKEFCKKEKIAVNFIKVDSLKKAKSLPCIFNNWAVFYKGKFVTVHLLNEGFLKKMLEKEG